MDFKPDPTLFEEILTQNQIGYGSLGRYKSSGFQNGSGFADFFRNLFSRVTKFATPLVKSALPHARTAFEAAKPHLSEAGKTLVSEAGKQIANKITAALESPPTQVGSGKGGKRKRRLRQKSAPPQLAKRRRVKRVKRTAPYDLPDIF